MKTEGLKDKLCPDILVLNLKVKTIEKQHQKRQKKKKKHTHTKQIPALTQLASS